MQRPRLLQRRSLWRCPTYTRNGSAPSCGRVTIDAVGIEGLLVARTLDKAAGLNLAAVVEEQDDRGRDAAELVAQLTDLDRRAADAASSFAKPGGITLLVLESTTAAIERERTRVKKQLGELASGTWRLTSLSRTPCGRHGITGSPSTRSGS